VFSLWAPIEPTCLRFAKNGRRQIVAEVSHRGAAADPGLIRQAANSSIRERNVLRIGDVFALWYPTTKSIVGASPFSGRLTTDHFKKFSADAGSFLQPRRDWSGRLVIRKRRGIARKILNSVGQASPKRGQA
jgi:hypothetical protein